MEDRLLLLLLFLFLQFFLIDPSPLLVNRILLVSVAADVVAEAVDHGLLEVGAVLVEDVGGAEVGPDLLFLPFPFLLLLSLFSGFFFLFQCISNRNYFLVAIN